MYKNFGTSVVMLLIFSFLSKVPDLLIIYVRIADIFSEVFCRRALVNGGGL